MMLLCLIAGALALVALSVGATYWWMQRQAERRAQRYVDGIRTRVANRLLHDAWWFSEDPATMYLLQYLAVRMLSGEFSMDAALDEWRRYKTKTPQCVSRPS